MEELVEELTEELIKELIDTGGGTFRGSVDRRIEEFTEIKMQELIKILFANFYEN